MFGLMRRISSGFIPRADRPWQEDATSNAPSIGRKRRRDSVDRDVDEEGRATPKKARGDTPAELETDQAASTSAPVQQETEAVKEVTKGVKEVELDEKKAVEGKDDVETKGDLEKGEGAEPEGLAPKAVKGADTEEEEKEAIAPESVPLPEEVSGELDESASIRSTPPAVEAKADDDAEAEVDAAPADTTVTDEESTKEG
ncbi:hypothetical protein VKT23_020446 [Stygiomarasmius scandens]|uniref:Pinin n=1 Tax=Marasmiellus scandens TaxID=2682957 RepID=A0ABR1ILK6_9AGAR